MRGNWALLVAQGQPSENDFENSQIRLTDGTLLFSPDPFTTGGKVEEATFRMASIDAGIKYKGLSLLLDAIELLRAEGIHVHLGVAGAGDIADERGRLDALGAEVVNRWQPRWRTAACPASASRFATWTASSTRRRSVMPTTCRTIRAHPR